MIYLTFFPFFVLVYLSLITSLYHNIHFSQFLVCILVFLFIITLKSPSENISIKEISVSVSTDSFSYDHVYMFLLIPVYCGTRVILLTF